MILSSIYGHGLSRYVALGICGSWQSIAQQNDILVLRISPPYGYWLYSLTCCPKCGPRTTSTSREHQPQKQIYGPCLWPVGAQVVLQLERCRRPSHQVCMWGHCLSGKLQLRGHPPQRAPQMAVLPSCMESHPASFLASFPSPLPWCSLHVQRCCTPRTLS